MATSVISNDSACHVGAVAKWDETSALTLTQHIQQDKKKTVKINTQKNKIRVIRKVVYKKSKLPVYNPAYFCNYVDLDKLNDKQKLHFINFFKGNFQKFFKKQWMKKSVKKLKLLRTNDIVFTVTDVDCTKALIVRSHIS